jgi:diacylglycerol kinase
MVVKKNLSRKFSLADRLKSFIHAYNGLRVLLREEPNAKIHFVAVGGVLLVSVLVGLKPYEWVAIVFSIGLVITTELINTALENMADFLTTEQNEKIKKIKDISAAAVLISALVAMSIALIIFLPKLNVW